MLERPHLEPPRQGFGLEIRKIIYLRENDEEWVMLTHCPQLLVLWKCNKILERNKPSANLCWGTWTLRKWPK